MSWIQGNTNWAIESTDEETMPGLQPGGHLWLENKSPGPLGKLIMLDLSLKHLSGGITALLELK